MFQWIFGESTEEKNEIYKNNEKNKKNQRNKNINETREIYTYSINNTSLQERGIINSEAYRYHTFTPSNPTPTLKQGAEFRKLQKKIKKEIKKKEQFVTEGFGDMNTSSSLSVNENTNTNANANTNSSVNETTDDDLMNQYNTLLSEFQNAQQQIVSRAQQTVQRINPSNPYFKQNIVFSTGQIAYVTDKGIVKLYSDTTIFNNTAGYNGCPSSIPINVNIPWDTSYTFPGTIIPTTPPLMTGSPMVSGQMCGNEDSNILVNQVTNDPSSNYLGCYKDNIQTPLMTPINNGSQKYNNSTCLQAAIDGSYNYYGLQNMNSSTGLSQCFVNNDLNQAESLGEAIHVCNQQSDGYIYGGPLTNAVYQTPTSTFLGTYKDTPNHIMTSVNNASRTYDYQSCYQEAKKSGSQYFGLQYFNNSTQQSQCFISNDLSQSTSLGKSNASMVGKDGKTYGGSWTNAIYQMTSTAPYIGCYNDSSSNTAMSSVNNGSATYTMASCQQYALDNGFSLFGLQGVSSNTDNSGNPQAQCMVSNSLSSTQQYGMAQPCTKGNDGFTYGNIGVNALYQVTQGGSLSNVGKMGYIDQNGVLSDYPDSMENLSTTYTTFTSYDNSGNDISGTSYGNASDQMCQTTCNNMSDCYGYVFDSTTSTCYPKNSGIYPNSQKQPNPNRTLNIRNKVLTPGTAATNRSISNVDSNTWSNYVNSGNTVQDVSLNIGNFFGFSSSNNPFNFQESFTSSTTPINNINNNTISSNSTIDPVQQNMLSQLEDRLKLLTQQINSNTTQYNTNTQTINQESSIISENSKEYIDEYNQIKNKLNQYINDNSGYKNVSTILKDSNLVMTYQTYNYLLYAILLLGTTIVALKIINSK